MDYNFSPVVNCSNCNKDIDTKSTFPVPKLYNPKGYGSRSVCLDCQTQYHIDNPIPDSTHVVGINTGWNQHEKTFVEYCGKDNFHNNHEVLDSVPLDRHAKARLAKHKYDNEGNRRS